MAERKKTVNKTTAAKAETEKNSTVRATAKTKKNDDAKNRDSREEAVINTENRRHIISVLLFASGIFITLISVIPGSEGWRAIFDALHGVFGYAAYALGPLMIYSAVLISSNKTKNAAAVCLKSVMYILIICGAVQIFLVGNTNGKNFAEVMVNLYNGGKSFHGGGAASIIIAGPLLLLGRLGAGIIIVIIAMVCFLLTSGITVTELLQKIEAPVKKAKDITVEKHRQIKTETAIADEELERMERERIQEEIDTEQADKKDVERLKRVVYSVEDGKTARSSKKEKSPEKKTNADPLPEILARQEEDNAGYMQEIKDYIMERNRDVLEAAEKNERAEDGEDTDGELVPIIEAIHKFKEDNRELPPVREIVDAPMEDITTSDESELPFDLEDVVPEPTEIPVPAKAPEKAAAKEPVKAAPEAPVKKVEKVREPPEKQITLKDVYTLPPVTLLNPVERNTSQEDIDFEIDKNSNTLVETLKSFGVQTKMVGVSRGPSVTRYELQPAPGVKISKITGLVDDISLSLASAGVRIEAPIPNKAAVGIEVPNKQKETVFFRELVDSQEFKESFDKKLVTVLGKDIGGNMVTCNIAKMPHLLIAGTTGSGKSVCVNSIIMSILMKSTPDEVRLIMVDPKKVEFMMYNGIPHLLIPVVTDPKKAAGALAWAVTEMLNRYKMFSENNVRDFGGYNELAENPDYGLEKMSHIVIFIDELADLMLASPKDVEDSIVRLAQMARAAGMHLVIATQRPTVNVVTGLIKANIPSRIALMVASQMDSRVILDSGGAEKLLGNGDMLYMPVGLPKPMRVQGCFVSDKEVERTVDFIKQTFTAQYDESIIEAVERQTEMMNTQDSKNKQQDEGGDIDVSDDKLDEAIEYVVEAGQASTSALQRRLKLGYGRAARLIDIMEKMGVVGSFEGSKPRQVLMTKQEWYEKKLRQ